jgi:hypothetical protein
MSGWIVVAASIAMTVAAWIARFYIGG